MREDEVGEASLGADPEKVVLVGRVHLESQKTADEPKLTE